MAAGKAGVVLHTMAVLQAYQADLLKDQGQGIPLIIPWLCQEGL